MRVDRDESAHRSGYTILELLTVVAIIGIISSIAIPMFISFQLKSKTAEAKTNLGAIRTAEESFYSEFGRYTSAAPQPLAIPGSRRAPFVMTPGFARLGWTPEGHVFFSYGVAISPDRAGFTADAGADIDANGLVQFWGYTHPDLTNTRVPGAVGCTAAALTRDTVGPCHIGAGSSIF